MNQIEKNFQKLLEKIKIMSDFEQIEMLVGLLINQEISCSFKLQKYSFAAKKLKFESMLEGKDIPAEFCGIVQHNTIDAVARRFEACLGHIHRKNMEQDVIEKKLRGETQYIPIEPEGLDEDPNLERVLTRREHLTGMAMQGLISNIQHYEFSSYQDEILYIKVAKTAVDLADAALKELEETESNMDIKGCTTHPDSSITHSDGTVTPQGELITCEMCLKLRGNQNE